MIIETTDKAKKYLMAVFKLDDWLDECPSCGANAFMMYKQTMDSFSITCEEECSHAATYSSDDIHWVINQWQREPMTKEAIESLIDFAERL